MDTDYVGDRRRAKLVSGLVGYALHVRLHDILSNERGSLEVSRARQVAMYLAHTALGLSLARVALAFQRDRSTVAHACHLIEDRREDEAFDDWVTGLEDGIAMIVPLSRVAAQ